MTKKELKAKLLEDGYVDLRSFFTVKSLKRPIREFVEALVDIGGYELDGTFLKKEGVVTNYNVSQEKIVTKDDEKDKRLQSQKEMIVELEEKYVQARKDLHDKDQRISELESDLKNKTKVIETMQKEINIREEDYNTLKKKNK